MSEDKQVSLDDHEDGSQDTSDSESGNTPAGKKATSADRTDEGEGNDSATAFDESLLNIGEDDVAPQPKKTASADYNRAKKIEVYFDRVANGATNPSTDSEWTLDDIPEAWVRNAVEKKLNALSAPSDPVRPQEQTDVKFELLKQQIPALPKSKQEALAREFRSLKADGVKSDYLALQRALKLVNIETEAEKRGAKAARMKVPGGGSGGSISAQKSGNEPSADFLKRTGMTPETLKRVQNFNFLTPNQR